MNRRDEYLGQRSFRLNTQTHVHSGPIRLLGQLRWSVEISELHDSDVVSREVIRPGLIVTSAARWLRPWRRVT